MEEIEITLVHINTIRIGDAILCADGFVRTVCSKDLKYCSFMGVSIFGYNYMCGYEKVKLVTKYKN